MLLALSTAVTTVGIALARGHWNPTTLVHVDARTEMGRTARAIDPGFHTLTAGAYDGQFYWGIAIDPLATGRLHQVFDKPTYRYGHPLYGWLAWLASAGQARAVPALLIAIDLAAMAVGAAAASLLGIALGRSGWQGLFVAFNPGLLSSSAQDLAEPLAAALLLAAFLALVRRRRTGAWFALALLPLAKEPLTVVVLAVVCCELIAGRAKSAVRYACALVPALGWWIYARVVLGGWFTTGDTALGQPFVGWWKAIDGTAGNVGGLLATTNAVRVVGVAIVVGLLALFLVTATAAVSRPGPIELTYLALAAIAVCLASNATAAFSTAMRNTAFMLALVPFMAWPRLRSMWHARTHA